MTRWVEWRDGTWHVVDESVDEPGEYLLLCGRLMHRYKTFHQPQAPVCPTCRELLSRRTMGLVRDGK